MSDRRDRRALVDPKPTLRYPLRRSAESRKLPLILGPPSGGQRAKWTAKITSDNGDSDLEGAAGAVPLGGFSEELAAFCDSWLWFRGVRRLAFGSGLASCLPATPFPQRIAGSVEYPSERVTQGLDITARCVDHD